MSHPDTQILQIDVGVFEDGFKTFGRVFGIGNPAKCHLFSCLQYGVDHSGSVVAKVFGNGGDLCWQGV